jgi:hypothetical protein
MGHNADEGGTYLDPEFSVNDLKACAQQKYGQLADQFLELYPVTESIASLQAWNEAARDNSRVTVAMWADEFHKNTYSPVYGYFFTHTPPAKVVSHSMVSKVVPQPTPFPVTLLIPLKPIGSLSVGKVRMKEERRRKPPTAH